MTIETHGHARILVTAIGLFFATTILAVEAEKTPQTPQEMWKQSLAKESYATVTKDYEVLNELLTEAENVSTELCTQLKSRLETSLRSNPASLALQLTSADCATALGDASAAERHTQAFAELVRYAIRKIPADNGDTPIQVMSEWDAAAFIRASGEVPLYYYYDLRPGRYPLTLRVALVDAEQGTERWLSFDYLSTLLQFARSDPDSRFYVFRHQLAFALIRNAGKSGALPVTQAIDVQGALVRPQIADRLEELAKLGAQDNFNAIERYATYCIYMHVPECESTATDLLLPWAELRSAKAMILLAVLKAEPIGSKPDRKAAEVLLDAADRRLGSMQASVEFTEMMSALGAGKTSDSLARKRLQKAAEAGNPKAEWLLAARETEEANSNDKITREARAGLVHAAQSGFPAAEGLLSSVLWAEGSKSDAIRWAESAAAHNLSDAQHWIAMAYATGDGVEIDMDKAIHWHEQAANGGVIKSMLWLANHYKGGEQNANTRQLQEGWLLSAATGNDIDVGLALADLYSLGGEGLKGGPAQAVEMYREILQREDRPAARRGLAELLLGTEGIEKNVEEARKLLTVDAEKGDALSQYKLGTYLADGDFGAKEPSGRDWLKKAADAGNARAANKLGLLFYYNSDGGGRDLTKAFTYLQNAGSNGSDTQARNNLAWMLCTVDDASFRDWRRGLGVIKFLLDETKDQPVAWLDTLAACHAAAGEFEDAVKVEENIIAVMRKVAPDNKKTIELFESHVKLYKAKQVVIDHADKN